MNSKPHFPCNGAHLETTFVLSNRSASQMTNVSQSPTGRGLNPNASFLVTFSRDTGSLKENDNHGWCEAPSTRGVFTAPRGEAAFPDYQTKAFRRKTSTPTFRLSLCKTSASLQLLRSDTGVSRVSPFEEDPHRMM